MSRWESGGGELLFSGVRQARINCHVIYCTTDLLGKFSTEVRVTEKNPIVPWKAIKFLYGTVGGRVRNRFSLRQRTESGTLRSPSRFTSTDIKQKCTSTWNDWLKKKKKKKKLVAMQRRFVWWIEFIYATGNQCHRERQSITAFVPPFQDGCVPLK